MFSRLSVLRHAGIVDALLELGGLVVDVAHRHREGLGGGERRVALVRGQHAQSVHTPALIVQRGGQM